MVIGHRGEMRDMKDDTVSRQAAIDSMTNTLWHYPNECYRNLNEYEFAKGLAELGLKSVPPAQPECNRGRWIEDNEGYFYCDKCGKYPAYQITQTNYCPNCGSYNGGKN